MLFDQYGVAARFANGDELEPYISNTGAREIETIDQLATWEETIFLGLRLSKGLSISELQMHFPQAWIEHLLNSARDLSREGFMQCTDDRVLLTQRGRIVSSSVFGELLANEPVTA